MSVKIKVHDVIHEREGYNAETVEETIEFGITTADVNNVRVASGDTNSPLFITLDERVISIKTAKSVARQAVKEFSYFVDGIDVNRTVRDNNILVISDD